MAFHFQVCDVPRSVLERHDVMLRSKLLRAFPHLNALPIYSLPYQTVVSLKALGLAVKCFSSGGRHFLTEATLLAASRVGRPIWFGARRVMAFELLAICLVNCRTSTPQPGIQLRRDLIISSVWDIRQLLTEFDLNVIVKQKTSQGILR